ncbi:MAG: hypothetical protein JWN21_2031 [Sphingomonas bacterium]|uniref:SURF1 family protein n=1 Tax=Sphingomonas bacterium TaxID=1895847 RepID=UPI0026236EDF|nr:SURF1 family cytochrome oxidase biogenesis protein [Sphingomonas bacterium]MDB5696488.1 hypothetical protein [Sphingomonas bacterium]
MLVALLIGLGVWQLQRRAEKLRLIAQVERNIAAAPVPAPAIAGPADAYRRVAVRGRFRHGSETWVKAVTERGEGFWLITPLVGARTVLINRGFVTSLSALPGESRGGASAGGAAAIDRPAGEVVIAGLLRLTEPGGGFLRANDPARDRWFSRDVAAIARAKQLGAVAPYFIDAPAGGRGNPVGGLTVVAFRNNHLIYALTWFGLAALTAYAMFRLVRLRR